MALTETTAEKLAMAAKNNNEEKPEIIVTKITPQLMNLWNKELERLHKTLTSQHINDGDREWVKERIKVLHGLVFGSPP